MSSLDPADSARQACNVLVKICGICTLRDAEAAIVAGANLLGFIFVEGTPRAIVPNAAGWISRMKGAETVGVFKDAPLDRILKVRETLNLDWIQLHGSEPDGFLEALGPQVIRRVPVPDGGIDRSRVEFLNCCKVLPLVDPGGGDGIAADPAELALRLHGLNFGLAGGLTPETVAHAVSVLRPMMVDVSSGVEGSPRVKDHAKVQSFVRAATEAAAVGETPAD